MLVLGTALQINLLVEKTILRKGGEHMRVICINIQRASWNMVCCIFLGLEVTFFYSKERTEPELLHCNAHTFSFPQNIACAAKDES